MSDDLWLVIKPFSVYDPKRGRQDLRPGTVANLAGRETADLLKRGYIMRIAAAAPLFTDSPSVLSKPMKRSKE